MKKIIKGTCLAAETVHDEDDKLYEVWFCLPMTTAHARGIMSETKSDIKFYKARALTCYKTETPNRTWDCATCLGEYRIDDDNAASDVAAAIVRVLRELSYDKGLRQMLRITAWLAGRDMRTVFGWKDVQNRNAHPDIQTLRFEQCLFNAIRGWRIVDHLDPRTAYVLWSLAKVADRTFCWVRSNTANRTRYNRWVNGILYNASEQFGGKASKVFKRMNKAVGRIEALCMTEKDERLGNMPVRSEIWQVIAETAIRTL